MQAFVHPCVFVYEVLTVIRADRQKIDLNEECTLSNKNRKESGITLNQNFQYEPLIKYNNICICKYRQSIILTTLMNIKFVTFMLGLTQIKTCLSVPPKIVDESYETSNDYEHLNGKMPTTAIFIICFFRQLLFKTSFMNVFVDKIVM